MVFLLTKRAHYFYDAEAIRQPSNRLGGYYRSAKYTDNNAFDNGHDPSQKAEWGPEVTGMANARNVWQIPTQGRPEAHFATFPDELPRRCILAGTSEYGVCAECGAPWARQTELTDEYQDWKDNHSRLGSVGSIDPSPGVFRHATTGGSKSNDVPPKNATVGWQPTYDCGSADCPQHKPANKQDGHGPRHAGFNARWKESGGVQPNATDFQPILHLRRQPRTRHES